MCAGDMAVVRPHVRSFLRDPTEMALIYSVDDFKMNVYSMQTGSCVNVVDKKIPQQQSALLEIGLGGPQHAYFCHDDDFMRKLGRICWIFDGARFDPIIYSSHLSAEELFVPVNTLQGKSVFRQA